MRTRLPFALIAAALTCSLFAAPAQAQRARTFVASYGNDSNPCTFGSPCKTFQQAVDVVAAGGEVTAIDSAGFGPISITRAVTITSPDGVEAGIVPVLGGNAITIHAGQNDAIVLRGLTLDGSGSGVGTNGIVFNLGASLTIINCVVKDFAMNGPSGGDGIHIAPSAASSTPASFAITNTIVANNGGDGISYAPPQIGSPNATGVIDHVVATGNQRGIQVFSSGTGTSTIVAISNSVVSNNGIGIGAQVDKGPLTVSIDNVSAVGNGDGIVSVNSPTVILGRSVITGNDTGVNNASLPNTFFTYKDNRISGNSTIDITAPLNATVALQ